MEAHIVDSSVWSQPLGTSAALAIQGSVEKLKKASYCSVINCHNNSIQNPELAYFRIPSNRERAATWLEKIRHTNKNKSKKRLVCERHFKACYVNKNNAERTRLLMHAVPTLFLPVAETLTCTPDVADDAAAGRRAELTGRRARAALRRRRTAPAGGRAAPAGGCDAGAGGSDDGAGGSDDGAGGSDTLACGSDANMKPGKAKPRQHKRTRVCSAKAIQRIEGFLNRKQRQYGDSDIHIAEIIALYKRFSTRRVGLKYTDEFKFFALKLYCTSPNTYRAMQALLCLPTISTLYRYYIPSSTNVCENLIIALKIKVDSMTAQQKECAVCIGTLDLREYLHYDVKKDQLIGFHDVDGTQRLEPANKVLVVMVRGIYHNWKQAISYSFLAQHQDYEDVRAYVLKIISKMFIIGLTVRVLISDVETDFIGLSRAKKINSKAPYFHISINKIYYMYDPAHLLKNVREFLSTNNFYFNGKIAKWEHITACYDHECHKPLRLAPQLTIYHIIHTHLQSEKDKVQLAAEVFSKQTAAAVSTYAELKVIDEPVDGTVEWILLMNKLFNMLNFTSYIRSDETTALFIGQDTQLEFIDEISTILGDLRLVDAHRGSNTTNNAKIVSRLRATLKVIVSLHTDLNIKYPNKFPALLSRDCLDSFFDKVHKAHGQLPTCRQIQLSISKTPIFNTFQSNRNKETDCVEYFLKDAIEFSAIVMVYERVQPKSINACFESTADMDLYAVELYKDYPLQHLAAYLLYECYQRHSDCEATKSYAFENANSTTVILTIKHKHQNDNTVVVMVPRGFVEFIESLEMTLKLYFETEYQRNVLKGLMEHLFSENVTFSMPCECFPLDYVKCLYMRYRFNLILDYNNNEYKKNTDESRKCFVVQDL